MIPQGPCRPPLLSVLTHKMANIFFLMLVFSLGMVYTDSFATAVTQVCKGKFVALHCPVQDPLGERIWMYKDGDSWKGIGFISKNKTHLSPNVLQKFKKVANVFSNGSLTVSSFGPELSGIYACKWSNEGQLQHRPHTYVVLAVNCEKTVCEGDDATIECEMLNYKDLIPGLKPFAKLVWKKGKEKLVSTGPDMRVKYQKYPKIGASQGALRIKSVSKDMDGQRYTCVVYGQIGGTPTHYFVVVRVKKCLKEIVVCAGDSIDLECPYYQPLTNNTEDTRLEWYNGSTKIATLVKNQNDAIHSESALVKVNGTMVTLVSPGIVDSGPYRCMVFREALFLVEHSVTVNVTQCFKPGGYRNSSMEGSPAPKREAKADGGSARAKILSVFFAVLVVVSVLI